MKKIIYLLTLSILLIPLVSADVIVPLATGLIPLLPLILGIEIIGFWLLNKKTFKIKTNFLDVIFLIIFANLGSTIAGFFIPIYNPSMLFFMLICLILSSIIEYPFYLFFFRKKGLSKLDSFLFCSTINSIGYLIITIIILISYIIGDSLLF